MYNEDKTVGRGLKMMFFGQLLLLLIGLVRWVPLVGKVGILAAYALMLLGIYTASKAEATYKNALYAMAGHAGLGVLLSFMKHGLITSGLSALNTVFSLLTVYFVCSTTAALLSAKGDETRFVRGDLIWKLYALCVVVNLVCSFLGVIPIVNVLAALIGTAAKVVSLVAGLFYLFFLYKAQQALLS